MRINMLPILFSVILRCFFVFSPLFGMQSEQFVNDSKASTKKWSFVVETFCKKKPLNLNKQSDLKWNHECVKYANGTLFEACYRGKEIVLVKWGQNNKGESKLLQGHETNISSLSFSENEENPMLISGDEKGEVKIWDACTGELCKEKIFSFQQPIEQAILSPDNDTLAVVFSGSLLACTCEIDWDSLNKNNFYLSCRTLVLNDPIFLQSEDVRCVIFDSIGKNILLGILNNGIVCESLLALNNKVNAIIPNTDKENKIDIAIPNNGINTIMSDNPYNPLSTIHCFVRNKKGDVVAAAPDKRNIFLLHQNQNTFNQGATLKTQKTVLCMTFSDDGDLLFSGDEEGKVIIWNPHTAERVKKVVMKKNVSIKSMTTSKENLFVVFENGTVSKFNIKKLCDIKNSSVDTKNSDDKKNFSTKGKREFFDED